MTLSQDAQAGPSPSRPDDHELADAMRRFARFYTRRIGLLDQRLNGGPFSLTEARVLYELHARGQETASRLGADLGLDPGYLSRLLKRFEAQGLIERRPDAADARRAIVSLTAAGERAYAPLKRASRASMLDLAGALGADDRVRLLDAMTAIERLLSPSRDPGAITLRAPRPGDWGWVVERHAEIYSREFGWDRRFEADVAEIVAGMIREAGTPGTGAWVAERDGRRLGFAGLSRKDARTAKLRLVLLEAEARGRGLGRRLVETAIDCARENGDTAVELMTRDVLTAARSLYAALGFERMRSEPAAPYGVAFHDEFWRLGLS
jgi:DNA-binding MarR family transcriptional regulator/GNAT superfamily N-acetyltransferase